MTDASRHIRHCRRARQGFTLIEMATVVVIIAILMAAAIPSFSQNDDMTAGSAARVVLTDLVYAQSQAIATQKTQLVTFNTTASGGYTLSDGTTTATNPTTQLPYVISFGNNGSYGLTRVSLVALGLDNSATDTVLAFDSLGCAWACSPSSTGTLVPLTTGTITLQCGLEKVTLTVGSDGNVTAGPASE